MKFYLMIMLFLFNSLSAQWVSAASLNINTTDSMLSDVSKDSVLHSVHQVSDELHACCPSGNKSAAEVMTSCVYCGDNCQCDTGQLCHHTSPLMPVGEPLVTTGALSTSPVLLSIATLPSIALAPEFKPPQI